MFESWVGKTWEMIRVLLLTALALVISAPAVAQNTNGSGKNANPAMRSCPSGQDRCASSKRAAATSTTVNDDDTAAGSLESDADVSKQSTTPLSLVGLIGLGSLLAGFFMRK
jgi:hypothetical protein